MFTLEQIYWRLLRKSGIFNYWYKKHLIELLYALERFDMDGQETTAAYTKKLDSLEK